MLLNEILDPEKYAQMDPETWERRAARLHNDIIWRQKSKSTDKETLAGMRKELEKYQDTIRRIKAAKKGESVNEATAYGQARAGEHQWAMTGSAKPTGQIWVKTRDGKKYGPFKDKETANNFLVVRKLPNSSIVVEQEEPFYDDFLAEGEIIEEAEYQGRKVQLNRPFLTPDGPKKRSVYVKNDKGNIVKVNFGDPDLKIKKNIPERRKRFRARHNCENPGPKWKRRYWSCKRW